MIISYTSVRQCIATMKTVKVSVYTVLYGVMQSHVET